MELEVGDAVLCTVDRIAGTVVFVKIEGHGEGSIILSEIAPGRIRNLRNYVVPKKRIVCKVLRINKKGGLELTLRRVTPKERREVLEEYRKEKSSLSLLKSVLGEKSEAILKKISEKEKISEFLEEAKENPNKLQKLIGKENSEKILKILKLEKVKKSVVKKEISLKTTKSNGIEDIKELLVKIKEAEIRYISAGKYSLKIESSDLKKADNKLQEIIKNIKEKAKKKGIEFSEKEK